MSKYFKIVHINFRCIVKRASEFTASLFAVLGFVGTFAPLDSIASEKFHIALRIGISVGIVIVIWLFSFIAVSLYCVKKQRFEILAVGNDHHIYVQYGDIFSPDIVLNKEQRRNIVIPVNRCFDTIVDDDLIASNTLHGISMMALYEKGIYNEQSLNANIQKYLKAKNHTVEMIERNQKRKGNLKRYPVGSVAEIQADEKLTYFFLGLSSFGRELHAETSDEDYVLALIRMIEFCNARSQRFPVVIPLIGAGFMGKSEKDILEYLVKLLKLNRTLISYDVHIVVHENARERISIAEIR